MRYPGLGSDVRKPANDVRVIGSNPVSSAPLLRATLINPSSEGFFLTGAKPMALSEITAEITLKWWVIPLAHCAALLFAAAGRSEFPEAFVDFIVHRGTKIEIKG
jgi:hypothetical protein